MTTAALFPGCADAPPITVATPETCCCDAAPAFIMRHGLFWSIVADIRVYGTPKGQPRPRAFARKMGQKFVARVYDAGTADGWKGEIALAVRPHLPATPLIGAVLVDAQFLFPRPQSLMRKKDPAGRIPHTGKPDIDNLSKAALDCFTSVGFFADDAQVCGGDLFKWYVAKDERPGAQIAVYRLEGGAV